MDSLPRYSCNSGDLGSILGLGRSPGEGKGYPLQYSGLEKSMDYILSEVAKSRTRLSDFHFYLLISDIVTTLICLKGDGGLEPAREEEGPDH